MNSSEAVTPVLDEASAAWIEALTGGGRDREAALARLHDLLVRVAAREAHRRAAASGIGGVELDDLAYQAAADAMAAILALSAVESDGLAVTLAAGRGSAS